VKLEESPTAWDALLRISHERYTVLRESRRFGIMFSLKIPLVWNEKLPQNFEDLDFTFLRNTEFLWDYPEFLRESLTTGLCFF
jgi:hypothetical protein